MRLVDVEKKITKPPPILESFGVVIKQYPDKIFARTELSTGHVFLGISMIGQSASFYESKLVPIPKEFMQCPTYEAGSVLSGTQNPPVDSFDFDWDAYADLDSVGYSGTEIVMPDTFYHIAVFCAFAWPPDRNNFAPPNPFVDVYWNGKRTGRTPIEYKSFTPEWPACKIQLRQGAKEDILDCHLRINLFSFRESSTCELIGTVAFEGEQLKALFAPQIDPYFRTVSLQSFKPSARSLKAASAKKVLESGNHNMTDAAVEESLETTDEENAKAIEDVLDKQEEEEEEEFAFNADLVAEQEAKADKDFPHEALMNNDGTFGESFATVKLAILHCEFQVRVNFCQGIVNPESSEVNPFVIVIFNGRDVGMTDVKAGETWPSWSKPDIYSLKIGTLDIYECSLNIEVWQMGSTGRENLLGQVVYSGKPFVELVGDITGHFTRIIKELSMPIVRNKDTKATGKGGKKAKAISNFGKLCFDIGPVGMPAPKELEYEISIISGVLLPADNVYCQVCM